MTMRERTTKKQRELLRYLDEFITTNNFAPSYREIMQAMGYKSVSTVATHVNNLIARGYLKKGRDGIRTLEVVPSPSADDTHKAWLARVIAHKRQQLAIEATPQSRKDEAVLTRTAELLGLE